MKQVTKDTAPATPSINKILDAMMNGKDCTEDESAELKSFIRATYERPTAEELRLQDKIEILFPIEWGEALDDIIEMKIPIRPTKQPAPSTNIENERDEMPRHNYSDEVEDKDVEKSYTPLPKDTAPIDNKDALQDAFTGGDWEVDFSSVNGVSLWADDERDNGTLIATIYTEAKEWEANAALISQAKNMYKLLKQFVAVGECAYRGTNSKVKDIFDQEFKMLQEILLKANPKQ